MKTAIKRAVLTTSGLALAAQILLAAPALAQVNENGVGPDPDGDTNPATKTWAIARIGASDAGLDPFFKVVTFEPPPGVHNDKVSNQYASKFGVRFGSGIKRQICNGQQYFRYDTFCTYLAPPSGDYAAYYRDDWKRPLQVKFERPICGFALSVFPIGGKEGEKFEVTLQPYKANGAKLKPAKVKFSWTENTFRWRAMAGGFFLTEPAARVDVMMQTLDKEQKSDVIHFLMDDVSFVESNCEKILADIRAAAGVESSGTGDLTTKSAKE